MYKIIILGTEPVGTGNGQGHRCVVTTQYTVPPLKCVIKLHMTWSQMCDIMTSHRLKLVKSTLVMDTDV